MAAFCTLPLDCSDTYGALTIASTSLHIGAWCAYDLSPLYESPEFRGDSVLVERLTGRVARPVVTDQTDYSLPMMFSGAVDLNGASWPVPAGGLIANLRAFESTLIDPIRTATATLAAELVVPDPTDPNDDITYEFDCQPLRLSWALLPGGYARAVLRLRVPVPEFAVAAGE